MSDQVRPPLSPDQAERLAITAGLQVPRNKLASLATRLQAMIEGAALVAALPLHDVEPVTVFRHRA